MCVLAADEARNALTNANSDVTKLQNTIKYVRERDRESVNSSFVSFFVSSDLEAKLRVDYGPNEEFQPMEVIKR